jgi:hypothetical protein
VARQKHGDPPKRAGKKKSVKKKVAKKKSGKSVLERAAAKKRAKKAVDSMAPTLAPKSQDKRLEPEIVYAEPGVHPLDTLARSRAKLKVARGVNPISPIEEERAAFRSGPLSEDIIADICRMLRYTLHRETVERLLGLSRGRIKKWIRRGKGSREAIEAWHDAHDELVQSRARPSAFKKLGAQPDFDLYATLHACVLAAEANGEKTAVGGIVNAAVGADGTPPDWKASAWLLSRKYNKRWGAYAEREMREEEDDVDGKEGNRRSAVDRLADTLDEMFGKRGVDDADT